ncbi:MAG TPA: hypothetical protein EYG03_22610 [Planctomycetes bacterium]|nr:hypothetical protein [Planctomycetota bacterium]
MFAMPGFIFPAYRATGETAMLASLKSPETIRQKAAEVVSRPDYQLDLGLDDETQGLWLTVLSWILKPIVWIYESLHGLPPVLQIIVVVILVVILVALTAHMIWSFVNAIKGSKLGQLAGVQNRERHVDPRHLERSAELAAADGQYVEAVRFLFKAALVRIEQSEKKKLRVGITNRELLRRYQKSPLSGPLAQITDLIDRKWYGTESCEFTDYEVCQSQHVSICAVLQGNSRVVSA